MNDLKTKFLSRKFTVTMTAMLLQAVLIYLEKPGAGPVLTMGIAAYNLANVGIEWVRARNGETP